MSTLCSAGSLGIPKDKEVRSHTGTDVVEDKVVVRS